MLQWEAWGDVRRTAAARPWRGALAAALAFHATREPPDYARPERIDVKYANGPFKYLDNHWKFIPEEGGAHTTIDFYVDFEFRSRLLQGLIGAVFNEAVHRMVQAFEKRAHQVYGNDKAPAATAPNEGAA